MFKYYSKKILLSLLISYSLNFLRFVSISNASFLEPISIGL